MNLVKAFWVTLFIIGATNSVRAGVACKDSHPLFTGSTQKLLQRIENLRLSQKLGQCDVRIWSEDICDDVTQEFLYHAVSVTLGTDPHPSALSGFNHFDSFVWNFKADGSMILDSSVQKFNIVGHELTYSYHENYKGYSYFTTKMAFSDSDFTGLEFLAQDSQKTTYDHLVCGSFAR